MRNKADIQNKSFQHIQKAWWLWLDGGWWKKDWVHAERNQRKTFRWRIPMSIPRLIMYAHTYVGSVNITWSVSNLVPQLMDSVHFIEGPIMWGRGQHLQAWTESSRINKDPEKGFSPNQALSHYSKFIFPGTPICFFLFFGFVLGGN